MNGMATRECRHHAPLRPEQDAKLTATELRQLTETPDCWVSDTVAEFIVGIPKASLRRLRHEGRGPRYVKHASSVKYKVAWLLEYLATRVVETRDSQRREACA